MAKDLTVSRIDRQNILNNDLAIQEIQSKSGIEGILWDDKLYVTREDVANYFDVDIRTISRYIEQNNEELTQNGYEVLKGKRLKSFLETSKGKFAKDINVPNTDKYEYHYDHTDCIWYRPEARNRCPSTCAQYRDGWNDAMNYIFRDGKGYRPYRRGEQYGE